MKKILVLLLSMILGIAMLASCGYRDPNAGKGEGNQDVLGNIELNPDSSISATLKLAAPDVTSHKSALNAFITSFKTKFPNITVQVSYLELNNYKASVTRMASSAAQLGKPEEMYDLFWLDQTYINEWIDLDILSPIESLVTADPNFSKEALNQKIVNVASVNDTMYMMPRDYNQVVMYYNKSMFDAARVDYPSDTEAMTGAEFYQLCRDLADGLSKTTRRNDYNQLYSEKTGCIVDCNVAWNSLCYPLVKSFGGEVVNSDGEVVYDSDETEAAIQYWKSLVDGKTGQITYAIDLASGAAKTGDQFRMQQAPIYLHARAVMSDILSEVELAGQLYKGVPNLGVAPLPNFGGTYAVGGGCSGYAMYKDCDDGTAAWQFLKHVASVEGQNAYSETGDCVPVLSSLLNDANAVWRTCLPQKLSEGFNHSAFIYQMDAFTSIMDFYAYLPFAAQVEVGAGIERSFKSAISQSVSGVRAQITGEAMNMQSIIAQAKR